VLLFILKEGREETHDSVGRFPPLQVIAPDGQASQNKTPRFEDIGWSKDKIGRDFRQSDRIGY
jgi:hypothetical protein